MGYGSYVLPGETEPRGYNHETVCGHPGCREKIDKGLDFLCYDCTGYFCGHHLRVSPREYECFAGTPKGQVCTQCLEKARPLIVLGTPRSGTTIIQHLLNLSEEVLLTTETEFPLDLALALSPPVPSHPREQGSRHVQWRSILSDEDFHEMMWRLPRLLGTGFGENEEYEPPSLQAAAAGMYRGLWQACHEPTWFGDKSPAYCLYWKHIVQAFPLAEFIIIDRDRMATARSLQKQAWSPGDIDACIKHVDDHLEALEPLRSRCESPVHQVTLEQLEDDPSGTLLYLLQSLGMDEHSRGRFPMDRAIDVLRNGNINRSPS